MGLNGHLYPGVKTMGWLQEWGPGVWANYNLGINPAYGKTMKGALTLRLSMFL